MSNVRSAAVYVMRSGDCAKIGVSAQPDLRANALQASSPAPIRIVYRTQLLPNARTIEATVHRALADKRVAGEWFRVDDASAIASINAAIETYGDKVAVFHAMRLDEDLKAELQKLADAENRSLTNFVETALRKLVTDRKAEAKRK